MKIFEVSISGVDPVTQLNTALTKTSETEMKNTATVDCDRVYLLVTAWVTLHFTLPLFDERKPKY